MIHLNPRERRLSIGLIAAMTVWAVWALAVKPTQERIRTLRRTLPEKQMQLHTLQAKGVEYTTLQNQFKDLRAKMAAQDPSFELARFLETLIHRHKLDVHVTRMQPNVVQSQPDFAETVVTIEIQDVGLKQLVAFLTAVETGDAVVQVSSLHFCKDATNDALFDSTVEISSPRMASPTAQMAQVP